MCGVNCLHPFDEQQQQLHLEQCQEALFVEHEKMASADLDCGICMEKPFMKGLSFGILPGCNHVFCLDCIRSWRTNSETYGADAVRVCPVCRVESCVWLSYRVQCPCRFAIPVSALAWGKHILVYLVDTISTRFICTHGVSADILWCLANGLWRTLRGRLPWLNSTRTLSREYRAWGNCPALCWPCKL